MRNVFWLAVLLAGNAACVLGAFVLHAFFGGRSVAFESRESQTVRGEPIFNEVRYLRRGGEDVWLMRQSHSGPSGLAGPGAHPDSLAIYVDLTKRTARFSQFESDSDTEREYSVSCGLCHANGPRALRPRWSGSALSPSWLDSVTLFIWNLRIMTYGPLGSDIAENENLIGSRTQSVRRVPFSLHETFWQRKLEIVTCRECHGGPGLFAREPLRRMNFLSIAFLVKEGGMPPPLHPLAAEERKQLKAFLNDTPAAKELD
ncbi:MAG: hypothetical protein IOD12_14375 [Silvanigrellales bacterium]|nr:hypothetical protein [Silvanigrellales bacterium]